MPIVTPNNNWRRADLIKIPNRRPLRYPMAGSFMVDDFTAEYLLQQGKIHPYQENKPEDSSTPTPPETKTESEVIPPPETKTEPEVIPPPEAEPEPQLTGLLTFLQDAPEEEIVKIKGIGANTAKLLKEKPLDENSLKKILTSTQLKSALEYIQKEA